MKPALVLLFAAASLMQAPARADSSTIVDNDTLATVDKIAEIDDKDPARVTKLQPLMDHIAGLLAKDPKQFRLHFVLARCYDKIGMEDLAASEDKVAESAGEPFKRFVLAALKEKIFANQFDNALAYNDFASKYYPNDAAVLVAKSVELHRAGKQKEEEALLESAYKESSSEPGICSALASIKAAKGNYEEALKLFDQDLKIKPDYKPAMLGKAKILFETRRYNESLLLAVPLYQEDTLHFELANMVANGFCHLQKYEEAFQPSLVSLAVAMSDEQMKIAKHRIIFIWKRLRVAQRRKGLEEVSAVLDKLTFGPRMHFALAAALQQAGFVQDAELQYRVGLTREKDHARAYLHLGEICQYNYHNLDAAIWNYIKYLRYSGGDPLIQQRVARLTNEEARRKSQSGDVALRLKRKLIQYQKQIYANLPWWWQNP